MHGARWRQSASILLNPNHGRDLGRRHLLYEMDMALMRLRRAHGDRDPAVRLIRVYHTLLRDWAEP